jgi:hypothetical protein
MSEFISFLPRELADIGLMAYADPDFAERLVEALRRLPNSHGVDRQIPDRPANGAQTSDALQMPAIAL